MTEDTMDKKSWYHSELVRLAATGLMLQVTSDPRESKFPGKPEWCGIKVVNGSGDLADKTLNIENESVADSIRAAPKNVWLIATAGGTRDLAWLHFADADGPILPTNPAYKPPPTAPAATLDESGPVGAAVAMTTQAVRGLEKSGIRVDSDAAARIYSTHFINVSGRR